MGGGQLNNIKVGFVIQARMQSTRLPNKVLMPIPYVVGKPLIQWVVDAAKQSHFSNDVIVVTSTNKENDILQTYCCDKGITCHRGSEEDVLSRYVEVAKNNNFDVIVRLTGDNPIVDIDILDKTIEKHVTEGNDYTKTEGLPIGMNFEVLNPNSLLSLSVDKLNDFDKEHVTPFFRSTSSFKTAVLEFEEQVKNQSKIRLTIDNPSDFLVVSSFLSSVNNSNEANLDMVIGAYDENPWLFEVNIENYQKQRFENEEEELKVAIEFLKKNEFDRVVDKLLS